jgi:hypothetical protein
VQLRWHRVFRARSGLTPGVADKNKLIACMSSWLISSAKRITIGEGALAFEIVKMQRPSSFRGSPAGSMKMLERI